MERFKILKSEHWVDFKKVLLFTFWRGENTEISGLKDGFMFNLTFGNNHLAISLYKIHNCVIYDLFNSGGSWLAERSVNKKQGYLCILQHVNIYFPFFFSHPLKLQNELPLAAAQSLRSKKRQNLTKKLILGHLWNSIIRPIF